MSERLTHVRWEWKFARSKSHVDHRSYALRQSMARLAGAALAWKRRMHNAMLCRLPGNAGCVRVIDPI